MILLSRDGSMKPRPRWSSLLAACTVLRAGPVLLVSCAGASSAPSSPSAAANASGEAPAPAPSPAQTAPEASASSGLVTAPESHLARVESSAQAACALHASEWTADGDDGALRLRRGGPAFAKVTKADATIEIPVGSATDSVFVRLARNGWEINGHMTNDDVALRPAKPMVLEGFLVPLATANLDWEDARPGELSVTFAPSRGIKTTQPVMRVVRSCTDLTIDPAGSFDAESVLPKAVAPLDGVLKARQGIPLSVEPGRAPIAWLDPPNGDEVVKVLESRGAFVRIAWSHLDEIVFGWVPVGDVRTKGAQASGAYGLLGVLNRGGSDGALASSVTRYRCTGDVTVVADVHGETAVVGRILAGTRIDAKDRLGRLVRVIAPSTAPVAPLPGVNLGVPEDELTGCSVER